MTDNVITLDQISNCATFDLAELYNNEEETGTDSIPDSPYRNNTQCDYYEPQELASQLSYGSRTSCFHINCRGLSNNWERFNELICDLHGDKHSFDYLGLSEAYRCDLDQRLKLPGYYNLITRSRTDGSRGGVGLFIKESVQYKIREDLSIFNEHVFESLFVEGESQASKKYIIGVIYRPNTAPRGNVGVFSSTLLSILDTINSEFKTGIIMGDMNIDLLKFQAHAKTNDYLDNIFSRGYLPVITKPTRVCISSATLIDHIYTNDITSSFLSGIVITDLADHFGTYFSITNKNNIDLNTTIKARYLSDRNIIKFKESLRTIDFSYISSLQCPNTAYIEFMNIYQTEFGKAFPLVTARKKDKFTKREPWLTKGLLTSSRNKYRLFKNKLSKPTDNNIIKYKNYNRIYNRLMRTAKTQYYSQLIEENKFNMKKMWQILNKAIGKHNNKSTFPSTFTINNKEVSDKTKIAEEFNKYFSEIGLKTGQNVPASPHTYTHYLPEPVVNSMYLEPITEITVIQTTQKLKSKLSSGHDDISTKLLKETIGTICMPLTHIINLSFDTGIVPDQLKIAKVVPIFKASEKTSLNNYRPISLLPAISKLLEKIMFDKVMGFVDLHNVLYRHQYGFRPKHSTIHPIIHFLNHCAKANNEINPELTLAIFCDLSKAFDVINHEILLNKLNRYGIRGIVNSWFRNYLTDRKQFVMFQETQSPLMNIKCGVPQGSILGPLLYLIYVNDIPYSCNSEILSFADDTTLFVSKPDLDTLFIEANQEINKLYNWFCANKLSLNAKKTKYIVIKPVHKRCDFNNLSVKIDSTELTRIGNDCSETSTKFLGMHIDDSLSWKKHIANVNSKMSRAIFAIKQVKKFLPHESLRSLYYALVHPHLSYGILAWGNASSSFTNKTSLLQKRAVRTIHNAPYNSHTEPLFRSAGILKLTDLYEYQTVLFMYDYCNNKLPPSFSSVFQFNYEIQVARPTRQSRLMYIKRCHSTFSQKLPLYHFPNIWNNWFDFANNMSSHNVLKTNMKSWYITSYQNVVKCSNSYCSQCRK